MPRAPSLTCAFWQATLALLLGAWMTAAAAAAAPVLAIVDGPARVVDARATVEASAGLALDRPLILQTSAGTRMLRIAWAGGGHVDLGPDTQAMVLPRGLGDRLRGAPTIYLLRGWAKASAGKAGETPALSTAQIDLLSAPGTLVLQAEGGRAGVFSESGSASLVERSGARVTLPAGQFHGVASGQAGQGAARPPGTFLSAVPRAFRDTLTTPKLPDKPPAARELARASYGELRDWMVGEPALRRATVAHFSAWARDPGFRSQLARQLSEHPEWDPIVNPPPPKTASAPSR